MTSARAAALLLSFIAAIGAFAQAGLAGSDYDGFLSLGPRLENSPAERAAFDIVRQACEASGLQVLESDFGGATDGHSFSRILDVSLPGILPDTLAIVVPMNSTDKVSGTAGLALALGQARRLGLAAKGGSRPPISLRFVFLGAAYPKSGVKDRGSGLGVRTWIKDYTAAAPLAVLCIDAGAAPTGFAILNAGRGITSPLWFFNRLRDSLAASGFGAALESNRLPAYRLGLATDYGNAARFLEGGIPAAELRGYSPSDQQGKATMEGAEGKFRLLFDTLLSKNAAGFAARWDRQYMIFQAGAFSATLAETPYIGFLILFLSLSFASFLAYTALQRHIFRKIARRTPVTLGRMLWILAIIAAALGGQRAVVSLEMLAIGSGTAWRLAPLVFGASTLAGGYSLFLSLASLLVRYRLLTPNPHFYEFASLGCLAVDTLVFSAIKASFAFYFAWAFAAVALSLWIRKPWSSFATLIVMYLPLALVAADLAMSPDPGVVRLLIVPGPMGLLVLSGLMLPFFTFTVSPLLYASPQGAQSRRRSAMAFGILALLVDGGAAIFAMAGPASAPPSGRGPPEATISESYLQDDGSFTADLAANRRIGTGSLLRDGERMPYTSLSDHVTFSGSVSTRWIDLLESWSPFLGRGTEHITLHFSTPPAFLKLRLEGDSEMGLYSCSLPYSLSLDGRSAAIFAGSNPGRSLAFDITAAQGFSARLLVEADYDRNLASWSWSAGGSPLVGDVAVKGGFILQGGAAR